MPVFTEDTDLETLPPIIAQIAAVIGIDATEKLIERFAGCNQIYIPIKMDNHMIAHLIGFDAADLLARDFGGRYIWFPQCSATLRAQRNKQIVELKTVKKLKLHEVARITGVTVSTVCKVLHDAR